MRKTQIRVERVLLLKQVQETPISICVLAKKLNRDRSAVTRDLQLLERFGMIQVTETPFPGLGRQKWITPLAGEIQLTAVLWAGVHHFRDIPPACGSQRGFKFH